MLFIGNFVISILKINIEGQGIRIPAVSHSFSCGSEQHTRTRILLLEETNNSGSSISFEQLPRVSSPFLILIRIKLIRTSHADADWLQNMHNLNGFRMCVQHVLEFPIDERTFVGSRSTKLDAISLDRVLHLCCCNLSRRCVHASSSSFCQQLAYGSSLCPLRERCCEKESRFSSVSLPFTMTEISPMLPPMKPI